MTTIQSRSPSSMLPSAPSGSVSLWAGLQGWQRKAMPCLALISMFLLSSVFGLQVGASEGEAVQSEAPMEGASTQDGATQDGATQDGATQKPATQDPASDDPASQNPIPSAPAQDPDFDPVKAALEKATKGEAEGGDASLGDAGDGEAPAAGEAAEVVPAGAANTATSATNEVKDLFVDSIDVNLVNVDVIVTDKKGVPILGLTKEDFELFEEGRPMKITNFYAVQKGAPQGDGVDEDSRPGPPRGSLGTTQLSPIGVPEDQRLSLIVFIDHFNIHPLNRNRVMKEIRQFITQNVGPQDRVMLVTYTRSLKVEQPFTSDGRIVSAALSRLERVAGHASQRDSERKDALERIEQSNDDFTALAHARTYAESTLNDLTFTIRSLKQFVSQLAGLPGRKVVLHVSDGIPMVAGQDVFQYVESKFPNSSAVNEGFSYDSSRSFRELVALSNANRVTFYTMDAAGLRTYESVSASQQGEAGRGVLVDSTRIANIQDSLHFLANGTGGKAIVNRNRVLPALRQVAEDFRNYYSLGFNPSHAGTGRLYRLKVKVKRKGVRVRYRESYRDKSVETVMSEGTMASLEFAVESNEHDLELRFGSALERDKGRHYLMPIKVRIPLKSVTLLPVGDTLEGRLRVFVAAKDWEGATSQVQEASVPISIPGDQLDPEQEQVYVYSMDLLMRKGSHEVAIGLRDDLAAVTSFVRRRVNVGSS